MKRKNRVVVEITTSRPVSAKDATWLVAEMLHETDLNLCPLAARFVENGTSIEKMACKEGERVLRAAARK